MWEIRISKSKRLFIALLIGCAFGFLLHYIFIPAGEARHVIETVLSLISGIYLVLLQMLVIPLVLFSIINSILHFTTFEQSRQLSRVSMRSVGLLLVTTSISSGIAMILAMHWQVGMGLDFSGIHYQPKHHYESFVDNILGLLPMNPLKARIQMRSAIPILSHDLLKTSYGVM